MKMWVVSGLLGLGMVGIVGCGESHQQASAKAKLTSELNKLLAGHQGEADHISLLFQNVLDYEIKNFEKHEDEFLPDGGPLKYVATVKVEFESKYKESEVGQSKILLYEVNYNERNDEWTVTEHLSGNPRR